MPKTITNTRTRTRGRKLAAVDVTKHLNNLVASIHDQTFDNELNVGQISIVREHLRYALIVGYEATMKPR